MRVLAIGATGFIGRPVIDRLATDGHALAILHRGNADWQPPGGVRVLHGDRNRPEDWIAGVREFAPDVALDVIPYTEAQAKRTTEALRGTVGRLVALSSLDVYRNYDGVRRRSDHEPDPVPLREDAPLRERLHPYRGEEAIRFEYREDYDKIPVERVVLGAGEPRGTVLRLPAVYGPGDRQRRLRPILRRMDDGRPAILLGESEARWRWTRGYVENVAAAIARAVVDERAAGRTYNVGDREAYTERAWAEGVARAAGWSGRLIELPDDDLPPTLRRDLDRRYELVADTSRIREELEHRDPVTLEAALARTLAWERSDAPDDEPIDYEAEDAVLARLESRS